MQDILTAIAIRVRRWGRSLIPSRNAIVVTAFLALLFGVSYLAAFFVRGELLIQPAAARQIVQTIGWVVAIKLVVFYLRGFCHCRLHMARFEDLNLLIRLTTLSMLVVVAVNLFAARIPGFIAIPRSVLLLDWAGTLILVGGAQAVLRSVYEDLLPTMPAGGQTPVLVIDASAAGRKLAVGLKHHRGPRYFVAGLLDDDTTHYGEHVGSARVLGPVGVASAIAVRLRIRDIIVLEGAVYGSRLRALCEACAEVAVRVRIAMLPRHHDGLADSRHGEIELRIRDVELRDVLSRPQARLAASNEDVRTLLENNTVLITGAGGSIGSEICREIVRFRPKRLILVERSEVALFTIMQRLREDKRSDGTSLRPVLLDITNTDRTERLLAVEKPDVILHAAAFKHLPLMEDHPAEAIENNTLATGSLAELAVRHGVGTFVALSTDKAVNPSSIMGASKLLAERYLQAMSAESSTRFVVVRFGNVLASSGSAVPIFTERLRRGQTITITHPEVRRYFMTIDEAAQLVLVAASSGDRGGTYVLDMGEPIRIVDIVHSLAYVMKVPSHHVRLEFCGLRPGEKLDEELFFADEVREPTTNPLVMAATRSVRPLAELREWFADLAAAAADDPDAAAAMLMQLAERDFVDPRTLLGSRADADSGRVINDSSEDEPHRGASAIGEFAR